MDAPAPVLAKLVDMGSPTDRQSLANEVAMYQRLDGTRITPAFHGHVVDEEGRAIGFLLEYIVFEKHKDAARRQHGRQSLQACMAVLSRLHDEHGVAHGDPHDGNCLVRNDGSAVLIDFELAEENAAPAERARDKRILERCIRSLSGQVTV
ncbi:hypothetical protein SCUCBS95973_005749 [Sporothrix curviconia]|uniref:ABC1 atypical kinase-like domain-containing protein n=1 Tax=Sporothrix curviconia TaxID=1260050 RepID=A0ABP0BZS3_9PEZI